MRIIEKIWITDTEICVMTSDGNVGSELIADYPRLKNADRSKLEGYVSDSFGIHWPDLDEDLSFDGFFCKKTKTSLYRIFMQHPELNASAVARRLGISQSLFAQYISGIKKPSEERMERILSEIRKIGRELSTI